VSVERLSVIKAIMKAWVEWFLVGFYIGVTVYLDDHHYYDGMWMGFVIGITFASAFIKTVGNYLKEKLYARL